MDETRSNAMFAAQELPALKAIGATGGCCALDWVEAALRLTVRLRQYREPTLIAEILLEAFRIRNADDRADAVLAEGEALAEEAGRFLPVHTRHESQEKLGMARACAINRGAYTASALSRWRRARSKRPNIGGRLAASMSMMVSAPGRASALKPPEIAGTPDLS